MKIMTIKIKKDFPNTIFQKSDLTFVYLNTMTNYVKEVINSTKFTNDRIQRGISNYIGQI